MDSLEKNNLSLLTIKLYKKCSKDEYYSFITRLVELSTQEGNFITCEFFLNHLTDAMRLKCINELHIDEHEKTILHYVAEYNDFKTAKYLTENNAKINMKDVWGRSCIYIAHKKGNEELAQFIREGCIASYEELPRSFIEIHTKCNIKIIDKVKFLKEGPWLIYRVLKEFCTEDELRKVSDLREFNITSCYLLAARYGNSELLQFLLNNFTKDDLIEAETKALLISTIYGYYNIVETLLQHVTTPTARDSCGNTALCIAAEFGHDDIIRMFLRKVKINLDAKKFNGEGALHLAVKYGHIDIVKTLVNGGANIDLQDNHGNSVLMNAVREGYTDIVEFLIRNRVEINLQNNFKETALFIAVEYGHFDIVKLLIDAKANVNNFNFFDETPLLVGLLHGLDERRLLLKRNIDIDFFKLQACTSQDIKMYYGRYLYGFNCSSEINYEGSLKRFIKTENHPFLNKNLNNYKKIVNLLIKEDAEVHRTKIRQAFFAAVKNGHLIALKMFLNQGIHLDIDKPGEPALLIAAKDGRLDVVEILLYAGVRPNVSQENPISVAIKYEHTSIVKVLLEYGINIKYEDNLGETPLFEACRKGDYDYVFQFIRNGALLNTQNRKGETPLFVASFHGHFTIVKLLLEKHADVNKKTWTEENALYVAAFRGYFDISKLLLKRGAQIINQNKKSKLFLLLEVLFNGYYEIAKLLINHGADVNIKDYFGNTPLLIASKFGLCEITKLLLKQKVKVDEKNLNNETPLIIAAGCGYLEIVKLLLEKKATICDKTRTDETALFVACKNGHIHIVDYLLQKNICDINVSNVDGFTPIYIAAENGHFEIIKLLYGKNANIQANIYDETPLFVAARNGHTNIVEYFLEKGSKFDIQNYDGKTPLFVASENGHIDIVKILIAKGANVDTATKLNETALFVAVQNYFEDIIKLLLENYADIEIENKNGESPYSLGKKLGYDLKKMWFQH